MSARVLDGTKIRDEIFGELKVEIAAADRGGDSAWAGGGFGGGESRFAAVCEEQDCGLRAAGDGQLDARLRRRR